VTEGGGGRERRADPPVGKERSAISTREALDAFGYVLFNARMSDVGAVDPTSVLIDLLDEKRDYGSRSYGEVVGGVRSGAISIYPGHPVPLLRLGGMAIKGSGSPPQMIESSSKKPWAGKFEERAASDFDAIYESLVQTALSGEVKAQMYFLDRLLGKPRESREAGNVELLSAFIGALAGTRMTEVTQPAPADVRIIDNLD